jgi:hypothetical protein
VRERERERERESERERKRDRPIQVTYFIMGELGYFVF